MTPRAEPELKDALRAGPLVLFGAGGLGQRILGGLEAAGIKPCAFADNNSALWGKKVGAVEVLSPDQAARRFGSTALFVMAVWRPAHTGGLRQIHRQLRELGCERVIPFAPVLRLFPDQLLPHYLWDLPAKIEDEREAIAKARGLFHDSASRSEFDAQVEFRKSGNFDLLPPIQTHAQYFPEFLETADREHFVDCGAFDGDSIVSFLHWGHGRFAKIDAFEADPSCFEKLRSFVSGRDDIRNKTVLHSSAVAACSGTVRFNATGGTGAAVSDAGEIEVPATTLDAALKGDNPTFIKMDIEGAEPEALLGAKETIRRARPVLAICVYHRQNHLWQIPLLMRELLPETRLFLRTYCLDGLDTVCYAVPGHRLGVLK